MRLAVVVDTFPRWSERFIARELGELHRLGIPFTIFPLRLGEALPGADAEFDQLAEHVRALPKIRSLKNIANAFSAVPRLREAVARQRLRAVMKNLSPAGVLRCSRAHVLSEWLKKDGYTHVYAHFANLPSTIAWIAAGEAHLPLLVSVHARDLFVEPQLLNEKVRDAQALFTCHARGQARLCEIPQARGKATLMHHGLPLELFPFKARTTATKGARRLLAAGRFVTKKGFGDLLEALATSTLARTKVNVTIVGDGPQRETLSKSIAKLGLTGRVQLHPPEPAARLTAMLAAADLLVAPFRRSEEGDEDGIPNLILEAFALGVPVVGTDVGGLPEALSSATGFVAPAAQPAKLAEVIAAALSDPAACASRALEARALVEARHDVRRSLKPLLDALK